MPLVENKAANAIQAIKARRFRLPDIARALLANYGITVSISHLSRVSVAERIAKPELERALVALSKVMK